MDLDHSLQDVADGYRPDKQPALDEVLARARARRRTTVVLVSASVLVGAVGVTVALEREPSKLVVVNDPTPTPTSSTAAPPHGCGAVRINGIAEYVNFVKTRDTVLTHGLDGESAYTVRQGDLGEAVDRVTCSLEAETNGTGSARDADIDNGTASFLPEGSTVYSVHGFDPRCRVAAEFEGKLVSFVALDPGARTATAAPCAVMPAVDPDGAPTDPGDYRGAPLAFRTREKFQDCGSISRLRAAGLDAGGLQTRACILGNLDDGGTAEMRQVSPTIDVGERYEVIRVHQGSVELWVSGFNGLGRQDPYWAHELCTGIDRAELYATGCRVAG